MTDFDGSFGGWGVQPNPSPGGGLPNTEEQTGEEDISAVLYRDALFSDEYGSDVGPGGVSISQQAGISRAPKHGIVCLDSAEMGRAFCGGRVGTRATKMCIKADCTLKTHQVKARDLFLSPCMVFIQGPQGGKNLPPTTVFSSPAVPWAIFESESWYTHWSTSQKTLKAWQVSFDSLIAAGTKLDTEASMAMCERTEKLVSFGVTPARKRDRATFGSADSPQLTVAVESPLNPVLDDLGPSENIAMSALGPAWKALADNVKTVDTIARAAHARVKVCEADTQDDLDQVDFKLAALHSLLGERPSLFGTQTAFEVLSSVIEDIEKVKNGLDQAMLDAVQQLQTDVAEGLLARVSQVADEKVKDKLFSGTFYDNFVVPTAALIRRSSTGPTQAGDLWEGRLSNLELELEGLKARKRGSPSSIEAQVGLQYSAMDEGASKLDEVMKWGDVKVKASPPTSVHHARAANTGTVDSSGPSVQALAAQVASMQAALAEMERKVRSVGQSPPLDRSSIGGGGSATGIINPVAEARLYALEQAVKEIKNQAQRSGVTIMGYTFESPDDVKLWMAKHGVELLAHLFVDPLSLLALSDSSAATEDAAAAARIQSAKINETPDMTKYRASFAVEIPPILGKRVNPSSIPTDKQLAAIPKCTDWNTGTGSDGVSDRMSRMLKLGEHSFTYEIDRNLAGPPNLLATKLLALALSQWERVSSWMTLYHSEVAVRSHASKEECWLLVTSCVRTILSEAHMARLPGRSGLPHDMLWGTLQAHAFFISLTSAKIQGHPKIAVILQAHVVDHSTPIALHRTLAAQVAELTQKVGNYKGAADRAIGKQAKNNPAAGGL